VYGWLGGAGRGVAKGRIFCRPANVRCSTSMKLPKNGASCQIGTKLIQKLRTLPDNTNLPRKCGLLL